MREGASPVLTHQRRDRVQTFQQVRSSLPTCAPVMSTSRAGLPAPRVLMQCADYPTLLNLVAQTDLLCVVPHAVLAPPPDWNLRRRTAAVRGLSILVFGAPPAAPDASGFDDRGADSACGTTLLRIRRGHQATLKLKKRVATRQSGLG
jgi:hypothetical protein